MGDDVTAAALVAWANACEVLPSRAACLADLDHSALAELLHAFLPGRFSRHPNDEELRSELDSYFHGVMSALLQSRNAKRLTQAVLFACIEGAKKQKAVAAILKLDADHQATLKGVLQDIMILAKRQGAPSRSPPPLPKSPSGSAAGYLARRKERPKRHPRPRGAAGPPSANSSKTGSVATPRSSGSGGWGSQPAGPTNSGVVRKSDVLPSDATIWREQIQAEVMVAETAERATRCLVEEQDHLTSELQDEESQAAESQSQIAGLRRASRHEHSSPVAANVAELEDEVSAAEERARQSAGEAQELRRRLAYEASAKSDLLARMERVEIEAVEAELRESLEREESPEARVIAQMRAASEDCTERSEIATEMDEYKQLEEAVEAEAASEAAACANVEHLTRRIQQVERQTLETSERTRALRREEAEEAEEDEAAEFLEFRRGSAASRGSAGEAAQAESDRAQQRLQALEDEGQAAAAEAARLESLLQELRDEGRAVEGAGAAAAPAPAVADLALLGELRAEARAEAALVASLRARLAGEAGVAAQEESLASEWQAEARPRGARGPRPRLEAAQQAAHEDATAQGLYRQLVITDQQLHRLRAQVDARRRAMGSETALLWGTIHEVTLACHQMSTRHRVTTEDRSRAFGAATTRRP